LRKRWLDVGDIPGFGAWTKVLKMGVGVGCGVEVNEHIGLAVLGAGFLKVGFKGLNLIGNGDICAG
jgi:hypothetical protein